ncbi:MAG: hypothetical protein ACI9T7_000535 [Oleiphilaceae bacterium]|jgi:hypothetical protein
MMQCVYSRPFLCYCLFALILFTSQYSALSWSLFSEDDSHVLQLALSYDWFSPYFQPEVYQQLSIVHFTPLILSIYRAMLELFGLNSQAFVGMQLFFMSLLSALAGYYIWRVKAHFSAGLLAIVLIFSSLSLLPMLSRFYTVHYILGAIFALLTLLLIQRKTPFSAFTLIALFATTFLALLAKEIYLMLLPILWLMLWRNRSAPALASVTLALGGYMALRIYMLGFSTEGRSGQSFLSDLLRLDLAVWLNFGYWYVTNKLFILLFCAIALIRAPTTACFYLAGATLFLLPTLAAPHAFEAPNLHGDRLFFGFDCALVIASVLAIYSKPVSTRWLMAVTLALLLAAFFMQRSHIKNFTAQQTAFPSYKISHFILTNTDRTPTTILTPLSYLQGEFMNIYRMIGEPWLNITQNCQQALLSIKAGQKLLVFDDQGQQIGQDTLLNRCQSADNIATVKTAPEFHHGLLKWDITVPTAYLGGVLLIDRGIAIATPTLQQRLVRPKPDERYQLFIRKGDLWWFSDIRMINVY